MARLCSGVRLVIRGTESSHARASSCAMRGAPVGDWGCWLVGSSCNSSGHGRGPYDDSIDDGAVHHSQHHQADVRSEQESDKQSDVMERPPGAWVPAAGAPVMRQRMEHRRGFFLKSPPGATGRQPVDHASEDAEGESGEAEEGQHGHRDGSHVAQWGHFTTPLGMGRAQDGHGWVCRRIRMRTASPRSTVPPDLPEARSAFSSGRRGQCLYQIRRRGARGGQLPRPSPHLTNSGSGAPIVNAPTRPLRPILALKASIGPAVGDGFRGTWVAPYRAEATTSGERDGRDHSDSR